MNRQPTVSDDDVHRYDVVPVGFYNVHGNESPAAWRATCSCGWVGRDFRTRRDADDDGVGHVVASVRFE